MCIGMYVNQNVDVCEEILNPSRYPPKTDMAK